MTSREILWKHSISLFSLERYKLYIHALIKALNPALGVDTLCQYGPNNRNHAIMGSSDLEAVTCPDCILEIDRRIPFMTKGQPFLTGMDTL